MNHFSKLSTVTADPVRVRCVLPATATHQPTTSSWMEGNLLIARTFIR